MQKLGYYLFRTFIFIFKLMPFTLVYLLSDFLFMLFYYVFGYRKKVIYTNLKKSFPDKTDKEINKIIKATYKNLTDVTVEGIKGFSMSKKELVRRYKVTNADILDNYFKKGISVLGIGSHYTNWEWGVLCFSLQFKHKSIGIYKPLSNKYIDSYIRKTRAAWGMNLESIKRTNAAFEENKNTANLYFLIADQSPSNIVSAYWIDFLNQDTACLHGPENYAKQYNLPVVYGNVQRVKRGFYTVELIELIKNSKETSEAEITKKFMGKLESIIKEKPGNWLWTHKRWKRKRSEIETQRERQELRRKKFN